MRMRTFLGGVVLVLALGLPTRAAETFTVDAVHSSLLFRIKHLNAGHIYGRFNQFSGSFAFDDKNASECKLEMEVKIESLDTAVRARDDHLRGPDFFNAKQFPTMKFKAASVKAKDEKNYEVTGDLTIHGVSKSVTVKLERIGTAKDPRSGKPRTGWETTFTIKRSDYDMKNMLEFIGDEVKITVAVEGVGN